MKRSVQMANAHWRAHAVHWFANRLRDKLWINWKRLLWYQHLPFLQTARCANDKWKCDACKRAKNEFNCSVGAEFLLSWIQHTIPRTSINLIQLKRTTAFSFCILNAETFRDALTQFPIETSDNLLTCVNRQRTQPPGMHIHRTIYNEDAPRQ